jgi:hypothetical protein
MAPRLAPIPRVYEPEPIKKIIKVIKKPPKKPIQLRGRAPTDDQFNATLTFSPAYGDDAGRTYGASLGITPGAGSPEGGKQFYIRLSVEQHRVDPLLQGFRTLWTPPPGWTAVDGLGSTLYDEAISNPLVVTRVYLSPAAPNTAIGFLVVVVTKYKP